MNIMPIAALAASDSRTITPALLHAWTASTDPTRARMSTSPLAVRYMNWSWSAVPPTSPAPSTVYVPLAYCVEPACAGAPISAAVHGAGGETVGAWFAGALTVTVRAADVVVAPLSSRATAVSEYVPAPALFQVKLYGEAVALPRSVVPAKKSTRAIVPSASLAVALMAMLAGAVNVAPLAGLVSAAVGA